MDRRHLISLSLAALLCGGLLFSLTGNRVVRSWLKSVRNQISDPVNGLRFGYAVDRNVIVAAADGTPLAVSLYLPRNGNPPYPTLLLVTPYGKDTGGDVEYWVKRLVARGYAVAASDMRGRYLSSGQFSPYETMAQDSSSLVDWIADRPWSNGRVGTVGCSALGEIQVMLAAQTNPHHVAMVPSGAGGAMGSADGRYTYFGIYEGGIFNLAAGAGWFLYSGGHRTAASAPIDGAPDLMGLPSIDIVRRVRKDPTSYEDFLSTPLADPYWKRHGYIGDEGQFATPGLLVNTWQDQTVGETLRLAEFLKRHAVAGSQASTQKVLIGPGNHCDMAGAITSGRVGDLVIGPGAAKPYEDWIIAFLDTRLRLNSGNVDNLPAYRFYILGEDRWSDAATWPPSGVVPTKWYLGADGPANSVFGKGRLSREQPAETADVVDTFTYDPANPTPTRGGPICCTGNPADRSGPIDQSDVEKRRDVLVYTSESLGEPLRIAGPLSADFYVASNVPDTDLVVKLVDVFPDGTALNIQEGALRLRYRDGFEKPHLMHPDEIYRVTVDLRAIAWFLPKGHRLRLQISGSNFPRLERNLNTGGRNFDETVGQVAVNRIYSGPRRASSVTIPVWNGPVTSVGD